MGSHGNVNERKICDAMFNSYQCQLEDGHTGSHWHQGENKIIQWGPNCNDKSVIVEEGQLF